MTILITISWFQCLIQLRGKILFIFNFSLLGLFICFENNWRYYILNQICLSRNESSDINQFSLLKESNINAKFIQNNNFMSEKDVSAISSNLTEFLKKKDSEKFSFKKVLKKEKSPFMFEEKSHLLPDLSVYFDTFQRLNFK